MTRYAVDPERRVLVRITCSPWGRSVHDVAQLRGEQGPHRQLAEALDRLAATLWAGYTQQEAIYQQPAESELEDLSCEVAESRAPAVPDAEALIGMLRSPQPTPSRLPKRWPERTEETAHRVGILLQRIGSTTLTEAVTVELRAELHGVELAESGDLSGRAAQAVLLTRADASPLQVVAAFDVLESDPFEARALVEEFDPHSAAVAAAYWLFCATQVAARATGTAPELIVMDADEIEELPVESPTMVLAMMADGDDPYEAVTGLIRTAMRVGASWEADRFFADDGEPGADAPADAERMVPVTCLDPRRPAPDLLEDLLAAIHGAFLVWDEHQLAAEPPEQAPQPEAEEHLAQRQARFAQLVHAETAPHRSQLGLAPA